MPAEPGLYCGECLTRLEAGGDTIRLQEWNQYAQQTWPHSHNPVAPQAV